jgi:hypothetical protein
MTLFTTCLITAKNISHKILMILQKLPKAYTLLGLIFVLGLSITQAQTLRNETIGAMGSQTLSLASGLRVQQSIGQRSVAGSFASTSLYVSQGFLRGRPSLAKEIVLPFDVIAFPNAFTETIRFRFTSEHSGPTQVRIHDLQGKRVYEQLHQATNREIELQLPFLAAGLYLVELSSGSRRTQVRILKK